MRKFFLCLGLSVTAMTVGQKAHAQFAPEHSDSYLDSRRDSELRHQTLARMLMTIGMNGDESVPTETVTPSSYQMPTRPFPQEHPPRKQHHFMPDLPMDRGTYSPSRRIPAVVQVNREIGLSVTGGWSHSSAGLPQTDVFNAHGHESGWFPGFQLNASTMFDADKIRNVFLALHFALGSASTHLAGGYNYNLGDDYEGGDHGRGTGNRLTTDTRVEVGKGIMLDDRFMITPTVQAGYRSWNRSLDIPDTIAGVRANAGNALVGVNIHFDYALTDAFVLRGQVGWAELIGSRIHNRDIFGKLHTGTQPEWSVALGFDYRIIQALHFTTRVDYSYDASGKVSYFIPYLHDAYLQAKTHVHYLNINTGLAYAF